jgi:hypothetical protein
LLQHQQGSDGFWRSEQISVYLRQCKRWHSAPHHHDAGSPAGLIIWTVALAAWVRHCGDFGRKTSRRLIGCGTKKGDNHQKSQKGSKYGGHLICIAQVTLCRNTRLIEHICAAGAHTPPYSADRRPVSGELTTDSNQKPQASLRRRRDRFYATEAL